MKNSILEFDKRIISKDEMIEHYNYYMELVNKGDYLLSQNLKREAREVLKLITDGLRLEYKYYDKCKVNDIIFRSNKDYYRDYYEAIHESYVKVIHANNYKYLSSNLYDIKYYLNYWFKRHL